MQSNKTRLYYLGIEFHPINIIMRPYYVYEYFDPLHPKLPFYVGKGVGNRYRDVSQKQRNKRLYNKIQKLRKQGYKMKDITRFPHKNLTETEAFEAEKNLIQFYGREDLKTGPLLNYTDGGEGVKGIIHSPVLLPIKNQIIQMYQSGKTIKEISKAFNTTFASVNYILNLFNIQKRSKGVRSPNLDIKKIIHLYTEQHKSVHYLSKVFKSDFYYIKKILSKNGCVYERRRDKKGIKYEAV